MKYKIEIYVQGDRVFAAYADNDLTLEEAAAAAQDGMRQSEILKGKSGILHEVKRFVHPAHDDTAWEPVNHFPEVSSAGPTREVPIVEQSHPEGNGFDDINTARQD